MAEIRRMMTANILSKAKAFSARVMYAPEPSEAARPLR